jgi:hypothetical protein
MRLDAEQWEHGPGFPFNNDFIEAGERFREIGGWIRADETAEPMRPNKLSDNQLVHQTSGAFFDVRRIGVYG